MEKRRAVRDLIKRCKIDIFCLQEAKCEVNGSVLLRELGGTRLSLGVTSPAVGRSKGIMFL